METKRNAQIIYAVRLALGVGIAASSLTNSAIAAEEDTTELQRVQITGTRISRVDVEGATPVITITREDLDNSGFQSVSDFLRTSSFNSFGSFREKSGNGGQGQATLSLRGMGSSRTLILINGKRLPGSPVLDGQVQNLNAIPFAAVERIEILSDGASAVYGSDAIGGVVNILLRKDFEGGEVAFRGTDPVDPGGEERGVSIVSGFGGDRGRVTFALEADMRGILNNVDRPWLSNQYLGGDQNDISSWSETSPYARNLSDNLSGDYRPMVTGSIGDENCGIYGDGFLSQIMGDKSFPDDRYCRYDYTKVAANTAELDRLSMFMDAEYEINSSLTFRAQALNARVESFGRYAPAAGGFDWYGPNLPEETITYNGQTVTLAELRAPIDLLIDSDELSEMFRLPIGSVVENFAQDFVAFRFNNTGVARDTWQYDHQMDLQVGLDGFFNDVHWFANYQYDIYDLAEWGNGYVNILGLNQAAFNGWDPRHPDQSQFPEAVPSMRENANRRAQMIMQRTDVGAQFDGPMLPGGTAMFFVGGEYRDEKYFDETQAQAEADNIIGTSGGSTGGSRSAWAVFAEASLPFSEAFELNPAIRYDSYNDFGTETTGKISARFQPVSYWLLRASFGTGFRAPSLDELYQAPSFSASFGRDVVTCTANGQSFSKCPRRQYNTYYTSNPNLDPETSTQWLIGTVFDFNLLSSTDIVLSADLYYTEVENVITTLSATDIFFAELTDTLGQLPGYEVQRVPRIQHTAPPLNFGSFDTTGLDFRAHFGMPMGVVGDLSIDFQANYILEYNEQDFMTGPLRDQTGRRTTSSSGRPDYRLNLDVAWTKERHTVAMHSYFIPSMAAGSQLNPDFDISNPSTHFLITDNSEEIDSFFHHNLIYAFEAPWNARITVGVNNLTDEEPPLDSGNGFDDNLYPYTGRAYTASYTQRF